MNDEHLVLFEEKSEYQRVNLELRLIDFSLSIDIDFCQEYSNCKKKY